MSHYNGAGLEITDTAWRATYPCPIRRDTGYGVIRRRYAYQWVSNNTDLKIKILIRDTAPDTRQYTRQYGRAIFTNPAGMAHLYEMKT